MKRYILARCRADLNQVRRPGGRGFIGHSPSWIDTMEAPDFYAKQVRKGLLEVLDEQPENPRAVNARAESRRRQAEADIEAVRKDIAAAEKAIEDLGKKKASESRDTAIGQAEERLAVLRNTEVQLSAELKE